MDPKQNIQCFKQTVMIRYKDSLLVLLVLLLFSCSSKSKLPQVNDQLNIHDMALTAVLQQSESLAVMDTIYLYNRFSFDTSKYSQYYDVTNATIQSAFVDTFQTMTGGNDQLVKLWGSIRDYKLLLDSTLLIGDIRPFVKPTLILVSLDDLQNKKYPTSRLYFSTFATKYGESGLNVQLRYRNTSAAMCYYYSLHKDSRNSYKVTNEYHTLVE